MIYDYVYSSRSTSSLSAALIMWLNRIHAPFPFPSFKGCSIINQSKCNKLIACGTANIYYTPGPTPFLKSMSGYASAIIYIINLKIRSRALIVFQIQKYNACQTYIPMQ